MGRAGEGLSFLSGAGHREFDYAPMSIWATKNNFFSFFFFFWRGEKGGPKGGCWVWKDWEVRMLGAHDVKFPNNEILWKKKKITKAKKKPPAFLDKITC